MQQCRAYECIYLSLGIIENYLPIWDPGDLPITGKMLTVSTG